MNLKFKSPKIVLEEALNTLKAKIIYKWRDQLGPMCYDPCDPIEIKDETVIWSCESNHSIGDPKTVISLEVYKSITDEICKIGRLGYFLYVEYLCGKCIQSLIDSGYVRIRLDAKSYFDRITDKNSLLALHFKVCQKDKYYLSLHPIIDKRQVLLGDLKNLYSFLKEYKENGYTISDDMKISGKFDKDAIEYITGIKIE